MKSPLILTIDLGSSSCKICLWDSGGIMICRERTYYSPVRTPDGGAEIDPEVLWKSVAGGIRALLEKHAVPIDSIALVVPIGHISTLIFLDREMKVLRPALLYSDRRAAREAEELHARFSQDVLDAAYGFHLPASPSWPLPRIMWIKRHEDKTLARTQMILQPKDYVRYRITGEVSTDADSNRGLLTYGVGKPDSRVFGELGLPTDCFPPVYSPAEAVGSVSASASREIGLREGTPVLNGWNDFNAAVYGCGIVSDDTGFDITGTTEHIGCRTFGTELAISADHRLVHAPFGGDGMVYYGASIASGGSLSWFTGSFSPDDKPGGHGSETVFSYNPWLENAEDIAAGADGLVYLPYLDGERAPIWDPKAKGAFIGLTSAHTWKHMLRALLEGVGAGLNQIFRLTQEVRSVREMRITGGYAELELWNRIKASIYNVPLAVLETDEAAGLGGAVMGAIALGWYADYTAAVQTMVRIRSVVEPVPGWIAVYREKQQLFDRMYPLLKDTLSGL